MSRSRSLALITAAALTAALAPAALASAAAPATADPGRAEHDRIVAYWTPERMKAAKPRDLVRQKDGSFTLAPTPKAAAAKGKPGGGSPSCGNGVVASTGSSWGCYGAVKDLTGKVFFSVGSSTYVCSGAVADDGGADYGTYGRALVLTAGHCAWDLGTRKYVSNWVFIPDYDALPTSVCAKTKHGCWTADALVVHETFKAQSAFNDQAVTHDFAFAVVGKGGNAQQAEELDVALKGEYQVATTMSESVTALGYPQARPYSGADLVYCSGAPFADSRMSGATWGLACNMTGGASGGPWIFGLLADGSGGQLVSVNSYKYTGQKDFMYGPQFNDATVAVHLKAKALAAEVSETIKDPSNP